MTLATVERVLVLASFLLLGVYHLHLSIKTRWSPRSTAIGMTNHLRRVWVAEVMGGNKSVLAIQTFRNWIMSASFMASTAVLLSLAMLHASAQADESLNFFKSLTIFHFQDGLSWQLKWLVLAVDFFFAFFNFSLAIRYYNHASFMITLKEHADPDAAPQAVAHTLNLGAVHNTLGMRGYYLSVPFTLWLISPILLFFGTVVLLLILFKLDRTV